MGLIFARIYFFCEFHRDDLNLIFLKFNPCKVLYLVGGKMTHWISPEVPPCRLTPIGPSDRPSHLGTISKILLSHWLSITSYLFSLDPQKLRPCITWAREPVRVRSPLRRTDTGGLPSQDVSRLIFLILEMVPNPGSVTGHITGNISLIFPLFRRPPVATDLRYLLLSPPDHILYW